MTEEPAAEGRPVLPWKEIVVAGSAGKSSVAMMIAALLRGCDERVGLLDASSIHSPLERLSVDGEPIDQGTAEQLLAERDPAQSAPGRRLETIAGRFFEQAGVSWVVRTVALRPSGQAAMLVWTPALPTQGLTASDETERLRAALPDAAAAVSGLQRESVLDVLRPAYPDLREVAQLCSMARGRISLDGQDLRLRTPRNEYRLSLPLLGHFQLENAATAVLAVEALAENGVELTPEIAHAALAALRLPARMEAVKRRPLVIVDAAERPEAAQRLVQSLREDLSIRRLRLILGPVPAANPGALIAAFAPLQPDVILVQPPHTEAIDLSALAQICFEAGLMARVAPNIADAVNESMAEAGTLDTVCITGSRAIAAAARAEILGLLPVRLNLE